MLGMLAFLAASAGAQPFDFTGVVEKVDADAAMIVRPVVTKRSDRQFKARNVRISLAWVAPATRTAGDTLRAIADRQTVTGKCVDVAPKQTKNTLPQLLCDMKIARTGESLSGRLVATGNAYLVASSVPYNPHSAFAGTCPSLSAEIRQAKADRRGIWADGRSFPVVWQTVDPAAGFVGTVVAEPPVIGWENHIERQAQALRTGLMKSHQDFLDLVHLPPDNPCNIPEILLSIADNRHASVRTTRGIESFTGEELARWMSGPPPAGQAQGDLGPFARLK